MTCDKNKVCCAFPPPLSWTAPQSQEFSSGLGLCVMSLAVKCPLTVPGTFAWLRWGAALTVPGAPVAWPRWETRAGIISHPLIALEHPLPVP